MGRKGKGRERKRESSGREGRGGNRQGRGIRVASWLLGDLRPYK